jgi:hypothetical protein
MATENVEASGDERSSDVQLPDRDVLEQDLLRALLEPPDAGFARDLTRDIRRRLKKPVPRLLIADALRHLAKQQRGSQARDRSFVRSALLQRLQREAEWINQPIEEPLPLQRAVGVDALPNGNWSWTGGDLALLTLAEGRWGILHLSLQNNLDAVDVGQPTALVLADGDRAFSWSPVASARAPDSHCPAGCQGSLASVAVEGQQAVLGHLSFPLPADATPTHWGLMYEDGVELRPCLTRGDVATPSTETGRTRSKS